MRYISYIVIMLLFVFVAPGLVASLGFIGSVWHESVLGIAPWSLYVLFVALGLLFLAALHVIFSKKENKVILKPFLPLGVGFLLIPICYGMSNSFADVASASNTGMTVNVNALMAGVSEVFLRHVTGVLYLVSAITSVVVIIETRPNKWFFKKFSD
ncbi:TPA: hypothetical protein MM158_005256 [Klebsiella pneumoniae]|nr:hypothetical protein [Klebsiella pneumoniae]